ncbi:hypothetical protein MOF48_15265 [Bacillus spizizenii]|uniref:hypothetical protein n=1 Tax=Bacillus spizizenii TaxID=96241 RepID=UPI0022803A6F|nr:hypothetical protein [Bacillus spizizenii]MCY7805161.1 hypothetical protein [Bacillus spizizenii]MCY7807127.1 hypothetical protein [Bacillus spizizenii]MCY8685630.1 hypothetical protein [Bacillus spizizenii]MCY8761519.1 hypothetical protein [Bacillus spizizenii]MCY9306884.1 hypothetical protein [Bacillus spizizenii]
MGGIKINSKFTDAKSIAKYLSKNYGKAYQENITFQENFKQGIINNHSKKEIKMMSKRLEGSVNLSRDTSHFNTIPFTIFIGLFGGIVPLINGFLTFNSRVFDNLNKGNIKNIVESFHFFNSFYQVSLYLLVALFYILFIYWVIQYKNKERFLIKISGFKTLIDECIEEIEEKEDTKKKKYKLSRS